MNIIIEDIKIGLIEIPDEISLIIPIAGCGHKCINCHSPDYQNCNNGKFFDICSFLDFVNSYKDKVSCICFFEGGSKEELIDFAYKIKKIFKTALYTGSDLINKNYESCFDYIKYGHYDSKYGGLKENTTNQILLKKEKDNSWKNITYKFWRTYD